MMKVSIITCTYNSSKTIADTITSVNEQTYNNIEHIIIDGASKDDTIKIINNLPNRIKKIISEDDNGIYDAMNKGISIASGKIIGILNSNDVYAERGILEKVVRTFESQKCDALYGDLDYVTQNDINFVIRRWKGSLYKMGLFAKGWHPPHPTFFVKREIYKKYGLFDISLDVSADFELMLRFIERNNISIFYLNEILVKMRYGGESTGSLKNIIKGNINVIKAFRKNRIAISPLYFVFRFSSKLKQFINR